MKKFLLLIPLLSACAPSVSGINAPSETSTVFGPFKIGQTWILASDSKTEPRIPPKTLFRIEKVFPERRTVIGVSALASDRTPIQIEYTPDSGQLLVGDISPISFGSPKIRTCFFFDAVGVADRYSGIAAHFAPTQTALDPTKFAADYKTTHPTATDQELVQAVVQHLSSEDGGPCTLTLVK